MQSTISETDQILVSVIIPTYKRPNDLKRAVESVLNSTYTCIEVIVVDDNNDGDIYRAETENLLSTLSAKDGRIRYIKHHTNKNGSAARNTGIFASTGKYIMFLDDDDQFLPGKIAAQLGFMENHSTDWGACYTQYIKMQGKKKLAISKERREGNLLSNALARNLFIGAGSNLMLRRNVVIELGGFDESFQRNQDQEFLVRVLKQYKLGFVDVTGLIVNLHQRESTANFFDITKRYLEKFGPIIEEQSPSCKSSIYTMIALQQIRYAIVKRDREAFITIKKKYDISYYSIVRYMIHLIYRRVTQSNYGFDLEPV